MGNQSVLCYVEESFAYFTTQALSKQWGDDWDDAPYECNAGTPYEPRGDGEQWEIIKVAYDGDFERPGVWGGNNEWSVQKINGGAVAWLMQPYSKTPVNIFAGVTIEEFCEQIKRGGGNVYLKA